MLIPKPRAQVRFLPGAFPLLELDLAKSPANLPIRCSRYLVPARTASSRFSPYCQGLCRGSRGSTGAQPLAPGAHVGPASVCHRLHSRCRDCRPARATLSAPNSYALVLDKRRIPRDTARAREPGCTERQYLSEVGTDRHWVRDRRACRPRRRGGHR